MTNNTNYLQIREFYVHLNVGQPRHYTVDNMDDFDEIVRVYGLGIIHSITFYFYDNDNQFHNIILQNTGHNNMFVVEFFHYYNSNYQRVEQNRSQQRNDFQSVMNVLSSRQHLQTRFIPYIIHPFQIHN
jgi:hypothetical protein